MKKFAKKTLCLLLTAVLTLSLFACTQSGGQETTKPVNKVPATQPSFDETTTPIYTRPGDEDDPDATADDALDAPSVGGDPLEGEQGDNDTDNDTGAADSTDSVTDNDTGDAFADGAVSSNATGVAKPLSWANINSFPVKTTGMSVTQMRKLCVDFFRYAKTALWTPNKSIDYVKNAKGTNDSMTGGQLYGGLPYVGNASGNIYRLMDYMDANGKVDMADMLNLTGSRLSTTDLRYFGNQCANGVAVGWQRVINSVTKTHTAAITPASGYVMLGSYSKDESKLNSITAWSTTYGTDEFCRANGEQVMFKAYAKLQMGDGLVYYTTAGHVIMAATDAHVEYIGNTDVIDGEKSYITIIDQAQTWETQTAADGSKYKVKNSVDAKVTFQKLYNSNYVPFTFKEFLGQDPVEATTISLNHSGSSASFADLMGKTLNSNYSITDAYVIVKDSAGKEVYKHAVRNTTSWGKTLTLKETGANVDAWGTLPTAGTYTVSVVAQLGTGERPTVYSGTLTF